MPYTIAELPMPSWAVPVVIFAVLIGLAVGVMIQVFLYWVVSIFVMPGTGNLRNAFRFLGYKLLLGITTIAVFIGFARLSLPFIDLKSSSFPLFAALLAIAAFVALIFFVFKIIMHVYEVSFLKALEFEVVLILVGVCLSVANILFLPHSKPVEMAITASRQKQRVAIQQVLQALLGKKESAATPEPESQPAPVPTSLPATPRPMPAEIALLEPVQITLTLDGTNTGTVTLPRGTRLKLISAQGSQVRVQYLQTMTTIPRKSTDLPAESP